jgi:hypothetical protein
LPFSDETLLSPRDVTGCFSSTYLEAREKFLRICECNDLVVDSRLNPNTEGSRGEQLYTDIVRIGPADAPKILLLISGTHGVEGYCGSGVQTGLLKSGAFEFIPDDTSVVMIHAINPYGFSHDRRVTEDNVDLNRNFIDFDALDRPKSNYDEIHDALLPSDWDGEGRGRADAQLAAYIQARGMRDFQAAVSSGQYQFADGLFYGGDRETWSNTTLRSVVSDYLSDARLLGIVDFHTGLGPYGHGELIAIGSSEDKARAQAWYDGQTTDPEKGTSSSADLDGMLAHCIARALPDADLAFITIEFGTLDVNKVLSALRGDNWLNQIKNRESPLRPAIKRDIRAAFYPEQDDWKQSVWSRSRKVIELALNGLAKTSLE